MLGAVGLAVSAALTGVGSADAKREHAGPLHRPGAPILAVVALAEQRVTIYGAEGKMLQTLVKRLVQPQSWCVSRTLPWVEA